MRRILGYLLISAILIAGVTYGSCGGFRPSVDVTPIRIVGIPVASLPEVETRISLRIDFHTQPELILEKRSGTARYRPCDSASGYDHFAFVYVEGQILGPAQSTFDASRLGPAGRVVYSVYIPIEFVPSRFKNPDAEAYDLQEQPRAICVWVKLAKAGDVVHKESNQMKFSADEVSTALESVQ